MVVGEQTRALVFSTNYFSYYMCRLQLNVFPFLNFLSSILLSFKKLDPLLLQIIICTCVLPYVMERAPCCSLLGVFIRLDTADTTTIYH